MESQISKDIRKGIMYLMAANFTAAVLFFAIYTIYPNVLLPIIGSINILAGIAIIFLGQRIKRKFGDEPKIDN